MTRLVYTVVVIVSNRRCYHHGRTWKPATEVYRAAHTLLFAHAYAVACYRTQFKGTQGGLIAVTLNCDWRQPKEITCASDVTAAERSLAFFIMGTIHP